MTLVFVIRGSECAERIGFSPRVSVITTHSMGSVVKKIISDGVVY